MGGQSFKCPRCDRWYLSKISLHDHLVGKHQEPKGFVIISIANFTKIERNTDNVQQQSV